MERNRETYKLQISRWNIEYTIYQENQDEYKLSNIKISPLYPYEAEIIREKLEGEYEWSYDEKRKEITLWPKTKLTFKEKGDFIEKLTYQIIRSYPDMINSIKIETIFEQLIQASWLTWKEGDKLRLRKTIINQYYIVIEVEAKEEKPALLLPTLSIKIYQASMKRATLITKLIKSKIPETVIETVYPVLQLTIKLKAIPTIFLRQKLDNILNILKEVIKEIGHYNSYTRRP